MKASLIESMLLDPGFDYLRPYFYTNPFALRCELGIGDDAEEYMHSARARAREIYSILFPCGADMISFNYRIFDWFDSGEADAARYGGADETAEMWENIIRSETRALRFLCDCQTKYRHVSVKGLKPCADPEDPDDETARRNRIVCYSDGLGFDDLALIDAQIESEDNFEVSLVSSENECILSVYDDRGCDVVFATREKMERFYPLLQPYFLPYDMEEMERRVRKF